MTGLRLAVYAACLLLLPIAVAWLGIGVAGALALVVLALLWRWGISLSAMVAPARVPALELETIQASHFVEKVRWCLDRLGVDYVEKPVGGTLGAFFAGRTVPVLHFRSGAVRSSIGNSPEILRYLWGRYAAERPERAAFLEPTPERLALEERIDRCGVDLQIWVYYHLLPDRALTLRAWGAYSPALPAWQRLVLRLMFPALRFLIRRAFRISARRKDMAVEHVSELLADVEQRLADGRGFILGGEAPDYTDFAFAAIMGLWALPPRFGGGRAEDVKPDLEQCPGAMREEIAHWRESCPRAHAHIVKLYEDYR